MATTVIADGANTVIAYPIPHPNTITQSHNHTVCGELISGGDVRKQVWGGCSLTVSNQSGDTLVQGCAARVCQSAISQGTPLYKRALPASISQQ